MPLADAEKICVRINDESEGGNRAVSCRRTWRVLRHVVIDRIVRHGFD